ncbi:hypothetical protein KIW84_033417 [Lathyrus oleraceus]|uniref:Uncharacterized protein n=1 Tax=Pisum sativum TaxID=3888 RepID=A0A9D5B337_PEA|nr:hypothetical protein KIW84_033417 [Pisum sativum]
MLLAIHLESRKFRLTSLAGIMVLIGTVNDGFHLREIAPESRKHDVADGVVPALGYFPQDGYVLKYLSVPPNCLYVPVVSDGVGIISSDPSVTVLRKLLRQIEVIKSSRSGEPNFKSHQVEANDSQFVVDQQLRK